MSVLCLFNKNRTGIISVLVLLFSLFQSLVSAQERLYPNEFPLKDVTLLDGPFKHARDLNIKVLLQYDVDRLLAGYRKEAGLSSKAKSYPNWDGLDGHVAGHYMSALSINVAATVNVECKKRLDYMIAELHACQQANAKKYPDWGTGYLGAVPNGSRLWPKVKSGDIGVVSQYWVPWYNVHKMYAGLRDAWLYAGNETAKKMFLDFCDWGISIVSGLADDQMESMLGSEHGGMNEIYADAYQMTGDQKYMATARRFSHKQILDPMSQGRDVLDNKHANTQVPKAVGFQRIAELSHDDKYSKAGSFFWETVTANRSLAFGGNSRREFFPSAAACSHYVNDVEGPETCNSYNMLKLTEDLFRVAPSARYSDFYERTMYNHILSSQHPVHGGYVYFTPARPRHYRVYSAPNEGMWCCVGSGMENQAKYNQFIYTHQNDQLFLNLFIPSELTWREKGIKIRQQTAFPAEEKTTLTILSGAAHFCMMVRCPYWVRNGGFKIRVNGQYVSYTILPSSYVAVERSWKKGDVIEIDLPMKNTVVQLPNVPDYIALMHGPVLLGAKTGTEDMTGLIAGDSRWGHIASGKKMPLNEAPILIVDNKQDLAGKIVPVAGKPLTFTLEGVEVVNPFHIVLEPFYAIHDARYEIYWMALSRGGYRAYTDSLALAEKHMLELQKRTVDFVAPGEQQPEADHFIQQKNSSTGNNQDAFWRDARDNGFFSYSLSTNKETGLVLIVRYWGAEYGKRKFDIWVDDEKLVTEDNSQRWNQNKFIDVEYPLSDTLLEGKDKVRIKFQPQAGNTAGAVYYVRIARKKITE